MSHTYVDRGSQSVADLFREIDRGVYAVGATGGESTAGSFTFSAKYGYLVENGNRTELLRDVMFKGNVFESFRQLDGISDDLQFYDGGLCSKGDQRGLPVSIGSPHLRVRDFQVGGTV
jgi:TldD protein